VQPVGTASDAREIAAVAEAVWIGPAWPAPAIGEPLTALRAVIKEAGRSDPVPRTLFLRLQDNLAVLRAAETRDELAKELGGGLF